MYSIDTMIGKYCFFWNGRLSKARALKTDDSLIVVLTENGHDAVQATWGLISSVFKLFELRTLPGTRSESEMQMSDLCDPAKLKTI